METVQSSWGVLEWLREAGAAGYVIVVLALLATVFGVLAASVTSQRNGTNGPMLPTLALLGAALVLASGLLGEWHAMGLVREALGQVNPCDRDIILFQGAHEARQCIKLALLLGAVPAVAALGAAGLWMARSNERSPLVLGGLVVLLAALGVDLVRVTRPYEGRKLSGQARDVLCKVLQASPLTWTCARELGDVKVEDAAVLRALPDFDPKKIDECIAVSLAELKPDAANEVVEALDAMSKSKMLDDGQRQRVSEALAKFRADAQARKLQLEEAAREAELAGQSGTTRPPPGHPEAKPHKPKSGPLTDEASEDPGLAPEAIQQVMRRNLAHQRYCYEQALKRDPSVAGKLLVTLDIADTGEVSSVTVAPRSTLKDPGMRECMVSHLKQLKFPAAGQGGTKVSYPFVFRPTN